MSWEQLTSQEAVDETQMRNKKIPVLEIMTVFFRFGSFNSICQKFPQIFSPDCWYLFFFMIHLLAVHTAVIDNHFNDLQRIFDMVVNTEAEYSIHSTNGTDNNGVCVQKQLQKRSSNCFSH